MADNETMEQLLRRVLQQNESLHARLGDMQGSLDQLGARLAAVESDQVRQREALTAAVTDASSRPLPQSPQTRGRSPGPTGRANATRTNPFASQSPATDEHAEQQEAPRVRSPRERHRSTSRNSKWCYRNKTIMGGGTAVLPRLSPIMPTGRMRLRTRFRTQLPLPPTRKRPLRLPRRRRKRRGIIRRRGRRLPLLRRLRFHLPPRRRSTKPLAEARPGFITEAGRGFIIEDGRGTN